jgi:hypothetical protein
MDEALRLQELNNYKILDTLPEKYLDELTEIASAICDTPISLLTLVDENRQWFKAAKGLTFRETPRSQAFCHHALHNPNDVLVVNDPLNDERFKENPLVLNDPNIRFYAGAPLETPTGNVLGTLCVIDNKYREISDGQKRALVLLAKKAMEYIETRRLVYEQNSKINNSIATIAKLTDQAPGAIFQLEMAPDGSLTFPFVSKGMTETHPTLDPDVLKTDASIAFGVIYKDDLETVKKSLSDSAEQLTVWDIEYRVVMEDGSLTWHWAYAKPEKMTDGTIVWYGNFLDINERKAYIETLEHIIFDISHVLRKPIANLLGLTAALEREELDEYKLKLITRYIREASLEIDEHIQMLNIHYSEKSMKLTPKISTLNKN